MISFHILWTSPPRLIFVICKSRLYFRIKHNTVDHKFGQLSSVVVSPDDSDEKIQIDVFRLNSNDRAECLSWLQCCILCVHWGHQWDVWLSGGRVCSESQHPCTTQDGCGPKSGCVWTIPGIIRPRIFIIRILEIYMKYILPFSAQKFAMDLHYFLWLLHSQTLTFDHEACLECDKVYLSNSGVTVHMNKTQKD